MYSLISQMSLFYAPRLKIHLAAFSAFSPLPPEVFSATGKTKFSFTHFKSMLSRNQMELKWQILVVQSSYSTDRKTEWD